MKRCRAGVMRHLRQTQMTCTTIVVDLQTPKLLPHNLLTPKIRLV